MSVSHSSTISSEEKRKSRNGLKLLSVVPVVLLVGLVAGRFSDPNAKTWMYQPIMNLMASFVLSWLIFPALWNYRKNQWLTR
jgi:hypothetical protein